jgi:hypothetical protein
MPARIVGRAVPGPLHGRGDQGLLHAVLRGGEVVVAAHERAEHLRRQVTQQVPDGRTDGGWRHGSSSGGPAITWRTSMGMFSGFPPGPGAAEARAAMA